MSIRLIVPQVKACPSSRPEGCPRCHSQALHIHQRVVKRTIDPQVEEVEAHRYRCTRCEATFRHYPQGVSRKQQSQRLQALAAVLWGLGLSLRGTSQVLVAFGVGIGKTTVWRDVQEAGGALLGKRRWWGGVRVVGVDETVFKVRGRQVQVGFVVDEEGSTKVFVDNVLIDPRESCDGHYSD